MGANVGEPHNKKMQTAILKDALLNLVSIEIPGTIVDLPYQYIARI
jgi:D-proline reductase (dithiol) PrdB